MDEPFETTEGTPVPAVTGAEMREVDRVAIEEVGIELLQMMENAGRNLAAEVHSTDPESVLVAAGTGGNGGGGLCCARHLHNRGIEVEVALDRPPADLTGASAAQHGILDAADVRTGVGSGAIEASDPDLVVDALVGYGLNGPLRGTPREMVAAIGMDDARVVSLDVPSGIDATTGDRPGAAVDPDLTLTLALPKTGLLGRDETVLLGDISIPSTVYERLGIEYEDPFDAGYVVELADS